jgi:hypothetical protein
MKRMKEISKEDLSNYHDFTGFLVNKRTSFINPEISILTFNDGENLVKVKFGKEGASLLLLKSEYKIGHIGMNLINIRPVVNRHISDEFKMIDFKNGIVTMNEDNGEDILSVEYTNGYSIYASYKEDEKKYYVTVLSFENREVPVKKIVSTSKEDMKTNLTIAIKCVTQIQKSIE